MTQMLESVHVAPVDDFDDDTRMKVRVGGTDIVVLQWKGEFHAFQNRCLHQGGPVGEGIIIGCVKAILDDDQRYLGERFDDDEPHLVCPWHGWEYDLRSGEFAGDRSMGVRKYEVFVENGEVYVRV